MKTLFSFDPLEQAIIEAREASKKKRKYSNKPVTYKRIKIKKEEKNKLIKEYNRPKECVFILPNGLHAKEILISGLGKGIVKLSAAKVVNDIKIVDKLFAGKGK